jgi:peptide/nickel transport system permease protein
MWAARKRPVLSSLRANGGQSSAQRENRAVSARGESVWRRRWRYFWSGWENRGGVVVVLVLFLLVLFPRSWLPESSSEVNLHLRHRPPLSVVDGIRFYLGTDVLGRDLLWRVVASTRSTLFVSGSAMLLAVVSGTALGLVAGYYRGRIDSLIMRLVDIMLAFPTLLLALALAAAVGGNVWGLVIVLGLSGWAAFTRVIRSNVLALRGQEFVEAALAMGATSGRILRRHLLPNVMSSVLVLSTFNLARFILAESAISFLGLGPAPPFVTWGGIIGGGRDFIYEAWWVTAVPGAIIFISVLVFNFLGDSARDAFDPHKSKASSH